MRASIRRIDLTQTPATVEAWPSIDWLSQEPDSTTDTPPAGPRGRGGLWAAMASAVARAREASASGTDADAPDAAAEPAEVIDLVAEAPHLAYLARVACTSEREDDDVADVIDFDAARDLR